MTLLSYFFISSFSNERKSFHLMLYSPQVLWFLLLFIVQETANSIYDESQSAECINIVQNSVIDNSFKNPSCSLKKMKVFLFSDFIFYIWKRKLLFFVSVFHIWKKLFNGKCHFSFLFLSETFCQFRIGNWFTLWHVLCVSWLWSVISQSTLFGAL